MKEKSLKEYRMKRTTKKECPDCGSCNIFDIGARISNVEMISPLGKVPEANILMYKCGNCGKYFLLIPQ